MISIAAGHFIQGFIDGKYEYGGNENIFMIYFIITDISTFQIVSGNTNLNNIAKYAK